MYYTMEEIKRLMKLKKPVVIKAEDIIWKDEILYINSGFLQGFVDYEHLFLNPSDRKNNKFFLYSLLKSKELKLYIIQKEKYFDEYVMSRRQYLIEKYHEIKIGDLYRLPIVSISPWALFFEYVPGVIIMVHSSEVSRNKYIDLRKFFNVGEYYTIKILSKTGEEPYKINGTRIIEKNNVKVNDVVWVKISSRLNEDGFYCEVFPDIPGIANAINEKVANQIAIGKRYPAIVRKIKKEGLKLDLII